MRGDCKILVCAIVALAFGSGAGRAAEFGTATFVNCDGAPHAVAAGDFNGDGILDLAVANNLTNDVSILIGKGNGTFQPAVNYPAGSFPASVAVGDFNKDGHLDLVVADSNNFLAGANLNTLIGNGDGTFQAPVPLASSLGAPYFVAVADLNGDGNLDLAVANHGGDLAVYLGNGDGTFQTQSNYPAGSNPQGLAIGDFNGDTFPDVAVVNKNSNNVSILMGRGDGTFQKAVNTTVGTTPSSVGVADFNADGKLDLAIANFGSNNVSIMIGNGDGTFQTPSFITAGTGPAGIVVADFNGDGKADFAETNQFRSADTVWVFLGNGDGTFQAPASYAAGGAPGLLAAADLNQDGAPDLEVSDTGAELNVLMNNGGTYVTTTSSSNPSFTGSSVTLTSTVAASINGNPTPTGTVTYEDGSIVLNVATLSNGQASYTTSSLTKGNHTISSLYSGDANFNPNSAPPLVQVVQDPPAVTITPPSLTFGVQLLNTTSPVMTVTLTDSGQGQLTITQSPTITGNYAQTNNCPVSPNTLAAGASCTFNVTFTPKGTAKRNGTVTIIDNAPGSPHTISLTGTGTEVQLVPTSLSFGNQTVGTTSGVKTVKLTNVGGTSMNLTGIHFTAPNGNDFAQTNNCGSAVAAGASCTFSITFTPHATGARSSSMGILDNGGGSPQLVSLSGTGT